MYELNSAKSNKLKLYSGKERERIMNNAIFKNLLKLLTNLKKELMFIFSSLRLYRNEMEDYKFLFKVVLVGNAGVGKTCLVRRFTQGLFPPGQGATIGVDFMIKTVEVEGEKIKVN